MQEFSITVDRSARFFMLGQVTPKLKRIWFVCHGYGHSARHFLEKFRGLENDETVLVAPEGLSLFYLDGFSGRVGASWMTKENRLNEIRDYVCYLDAVFEQVARQAAGPVDVTVLGFSQGTATASRWVTQGRVSADRLIVWAGLLPPDLDASSLQRLQHMNLVLVYGKRDQFALAERVSEQMAFLDRHNIACRQMSFDGGHELNTEILLSLASS